MNHDPVGNLESSLFDVLGEARLEAQLLALKLATAQATALALSEAHGKVDNERLVALMALENPPRRGRKKAAKGESRR